MGTRASGRRRLDSLSKEGRLTAMHPRIHRSLLALLLLLLAGCASEDINRGVIHDDKGVELKEGQFEFAELYGERVAELAVKAIGKASPIQLTPFHVSSQRVAIPVQNPLYRTASLLKLVHRKPVRWTGDFNVTDRPVTAFTQ